MHIGSSPCSFPTVYNHPKSRPEKPKAPSGNEGRLNRPVMQVNPNQRYNPWQAFAASPPNTTIPKVGRKSRRRLPAMKEKRSVFRRYSQTQPPAKPINAPTSTKETEPHKYQSTNQCNNRETPLQLPTIYNPQKNVGRKSRRRLPAMKG